MDGASCLGCHPCLTTETEYTGCFQHNIMFQFENIYDTHLTSLSVANKLLSDSICKDIISFCTQQHPLSVVDQVRKPLQSEISYVFKGKQLADYIFEEMKPRIEEIFASKEILPFGFGVSHGEWVLDNVDETFQVIKLQHNTSLQKLKRSPQRITSYHNRSLYSFLLFLNDDFEGADMSFYDPECDGKTECDLKDLALSHKDTVAAGTFARYPVYTCGPTIGKAVVCTHDLLSIASPLLGGCKWVLKGNIMVKRDGTNLYYAAIKDFEMNDYIRFMDYFKIGQLHEVDNEDHLAEKSYEKAISLSLSYPPQQRFKKFSSRQESEHQTRHDMFPHIVWYKIFDYLNGSDIEAIIKTFPFLYTTEQSWERQRYKNHSEQTMNERYIPTFVDRTGIITKMSFPDKFYFLENIEHCVRTAAIYSAYFNNNINNNLLCYNPYTQQSSPLALKSFLQALFYDRPLNGAVYALSKPLDLNADLNQQFSKCVDRSFMALRHNNIFLGDSLAQRMKVNVQYRQVKQETVAEMIKAKASGSTYNPEGQEKAVGVLPSEGNKADAYSHSSLINIEESTDFRGDEKELDSEDDSDDSLRSNKQELKEFERAIISMIESNFGPNYDIDLDFLTCDYFGRLTTVACFPLAVKDIFQYLKWEKLFQTYHLPYDITSRYPDQKWMMNNLVYHNSFLYLFTKAPHFLDVYGDGKYRIPGRLSPNKLYIKCLTDACKIQPASCVTVISEIKDTILVEGGLTVCVCFPTFSDFVLDRFSPMECQLNHYYNNLLFDFTTHYIEVKKESHRIEDRDASKVYEQNCMFYNSFYAVFYNKCLKGLENVFHYVVHMKAHLQTNDHEPKHRSYNFRQEHNQYDCGCSGPDFVLYDCFNIESFVTCNHIHVVGGTQPDTNEVLVWTALGGINSA